jgi:hypothetical protein
MARRKKVEKVSISDDVTIYKVCMPLWIGFEKQEVELARYFSKVEAEKYVLDYLNPFLKPFLYIKETRVKMEETD